MHYVSESNATHPKKVKKKKKKVCICLYIQLLQGCLIFSLAIDSFNFTKKYFWSVHDIYVYVLSYDKVSYKGVY